MKGEPWILQTVFLALEKLLCPVEGHNIGHRVVVILKTVALQLWSGIIMVLFLL